MYEYFNDFRFNNYNYVEYMHINKLFFKLCLISDVLYNRYYF